MKTWKVSITKAKTRSLETSRFAMPAAFSAICLLSSYTKGQHNPDVTEGATDLDP